MWLFIQSLTAARTALIYVTVGALIVIWTGIWYCYLYNNPPPEASTVYYWCTGFFITGLALVFIGIGLGRINQPVPQPIAPPQEVVHAVVLQPVAPAPAPVAVVSKSSDPVIVADAQVVASPPQPG